MFIIKNKKIFVCISIVLVLASIVILSTVGLKMGIDFKGGAMMEVAYQGERPEIEIVKNSIKELNLGEFLVQPFGQDGYLIKTKELKDQEHKQILGVLGFSGKNVFEEKNFNSIGPSVGKELRRKAVTSIILVILAIIIFIALAFRKVSKPVASWKYGVIAVTALVHDIIIPSGIFALLGYFNGAEIDTLFVVALLTILGISISDTIVVFDRIRENLKNHQSDPFAENVGLSLDQTFVRSLMTSLTVMLVLLSLFFFGPESTKNFSLVLIVGLFFGTYSSLFLASPLLVLTEGWQKKFNKGKK